MDYKHITFEKKRGIAKITLNRPPLNVLNIAMMTEINQILESLQQERLKLVVFGAQGKAFSAGVDVAEHTAEGVEEMIATFHQMFRLLASLSCPTLAVVDGAALGGGCELAVVCDLVIASERATFGQPEIKVGVFPPVAAAVFPQFLGVKNALELLLTGGTIDAREAHRIGLINRVVSVEQLSNEAAELVKGLARNSAASMSFTKRAIYGSLDLGFEASLKKVEQLYLQGLMKTEDAHEGLRAFLEKRPPEWKNK